MDRIEKHGFISEQRGSRARDVFITETDLEQLTEVSIINIDITITYRLHNLHVEKGIIK